MAKGAKGHSRAVCELDSQNSNVINYRGRDCGDEEEDGGDEDERNADGMEPAKHDCNWISSVEGIIGKKRLDCK